MCPSSPPPQQPPARRNRAAADPFNLAGQTPRELHQRLVKLMDYRYGHLMLTAKEEKEAVALVNAGADLKLEYGGTDRPLIVAVHMSALKLVEAMLKKGADVDVQNEGGNNPFITAAAFRSKAMVALILTAAPNPYLKDREGHNALDTAHIFERPFDVIQLIKSAPEIYEAAQLKKKNMAAYLAKGLPSTKPLKSKKIKRKTPPKNN